LTLSLWSGGSSRHIIKRIVVEGDLVLETPAHFSNGDSDEVTDMPLLVDPLEGKPLLTGPGCQIIWNDALPFEQIKTFPAAGWDPHLVDLDEVVRQINRLFTGARNVQNGCILARIIFTETTTCTF